MIVGISCPSASEESDPELTLGDEEQRGRTVEYEDIGGGDAGIVANSDVRFYAHA